MKRILIISIMVSLLLCSCSSKGESCELKRDFNSSTISETQVNSEYPKVITKNKYYLISQTAPFENEYSIFNQAGETVYKESVQSRPLRIEKLDEKILDVSVSFGTGTIRHRYYDTMNEKLSDEFWQVIATKDNMIAYIGNSGKQDTSLGVSFLENRVLIIQNIFNKEDCYKELPLELKNEPMPIKYAEFSDDLTQLSLVYWNDNGETVEKNVIID